MEQFMSDFLQKVNLEVDVYNAKVEQHEYHDLFE